MAEFLTTKGISFHIEHIIRNAKNRLILISPYLQLSKNFFERLQGADRRKASVFPCGETIKTPIAFCIFINSGG